jgi:hypothetical protein
MSVWDKEIDVVKKHNLDELPFDLFTRSIISSEIINEVKNKLGKPLRILDVGGRNGCLREFLPEDEVYILDLRPPESSVDKELLKKGKYFIRDICSTDFQDRSFNIVTSFDMMEHLSESKRKQALKEMSRISDSLAIIAAPFRSDPTEKAERLLNNQFKLNTGFEHEWLKEHIENKLPPKEFIEDFAKQEGLQYKEIYTNNIDLWLIMQNFICLAYRFAIDPKKVYRKYNQNYKRLGDSQPPTYRTLYILSKNNNLELKDLYEETSNYESNFEYEKKLDLIQCIFYEISKVLQKNKEIPISRKNYIFFRRIWDKIFPHGTFRRKLAKATYLLFFDWHRFKKNAKRDFC